MAHSFQIFDSLLEPCFGINPQGQIIYANETASSITGLSCRRLINKKLSEVFEFQESLTWLNDPSQVSDATAYKELTFKNSQGDSGRVQMTCQRFSPSEESWVVFFRDVTLEDRLQSKYKAELNQKESYIEELKKAQQQLEDYNKNLEQKVQDRTKEIQDLSRTMKGLLDSLDDGFFIIGKDGNCLNFSSRSCESVLEKLPNNQPAHLALGLTDKDAPGFQKWLLTIFSEMLPFEDLAPLGPQHYPHSQGKKIQLKYYPLRTEASAIESIICVAHDYTDVYEANRQAQIEKANAEKMSKIIQRKKSFYQFWIETSKQFNSLQSELIKPYSAWNTESIFRSLHTIKGNCASFHLVELVEQTHQAETLLSEIQISRVEQQCVKLKTEVSSIFELFKSFERLAVGIIGSQATSSEKLYEISETRLKEIIMTLGQFQQEENKKLIEKLNTTYFQSTLEDAFTPFKNILELTAKKLGKPNPIFEIHHGNMSCDTTTITPVLNTLVHAFVNAIDHGIESPEERILLGKNPEGKIQVHLELKNDSLSVKIQDDGKGIDPDVIRKKLLDKKISSHQESDEQVIQHIFDASFSTADQVTETSGRGVGMDAIAYQVKQIGGSYRVTSVKGLGSTIHLILPLKNLEQSQAA